MPVLKLKTIVNAPIAVVFDLSRSVDLHKISTAHTNELAVAGTTHGLMGLNDWVTWQAKHFGVTQKLTSKITKFEHPHYFVDEMAEGAFKNFKHEHIFTEENGHTTMIDIFDYNSPLGILGRVADVIFLRKYMHHLLAQRNIIVKEYAEDPGLNKKILL